MTGPERFEGEWSVTGAKSGEAERLDWPAPSREQFLRVDRSTPASSPDTVTARGAFRSSRSVNTVAAWALAVSWPLAFGFGAELFFAVTSMRFLQLAPFGPEAFVPLVGGATLLHLILARIDGAELLRCGQRRVMPYLVLFTPGPYLWRRMMVIDDVRAARPFWTMVALSLLAWGVVILGYVRDYGIWRLSG